MGDYELSGLIDDLDALTSRTTDLDAILAQGREAVARLLRNPEAIPEAYIRAANPTRPSQFDLHRATNDRLFITLVVWLTGQLAPIHDHQTWAIIGQHSGRTRERRFRRIDDQNQPGFAELAETEIIETEPGDIAVLRPPDSDIHCPENPWPEPSVTVHVYGRYLGGYLRNTYDFQARSATPFLISNYDKLPK
jgi:predicted metal-dependent enzyme (double-stranded beta helix superfamily)